MKFENSSFAPISTQVNTLTPVQLETLFNVYFELNYNYNFFMTQETHESFMNLFSETFNKYQPNTFKSLVNLFTSYTYETKYPHLLLAVNLIKENHSLHNIIDTVYHFR